MLAYTPRLANGDDPGSGYWLNNVRPATLRAIRRRRGGGAFSSRPLSGPSFRRVLVLFTVIDCSIGLVIQVFGPDVKGQGQAWYLMP